MPFEFSCFISYRRGKNQISRLITDDIYDALSGELELLLDVNVREVFLDRKRVDRPDYFDPALARALCRSVCMVMLYSPPYFSLSHTYCAREYWAMKKLEERRLNLLPQERRHALIIPIILRGEERFPTTILNGQGSYNFKGLKQGSRKITRPRHYYDDINEIGQYIADRYWDFAALSDENEICQDCEKFLLPNDEEIEPWLTRIVSQTAHASNKK